jgi:ATP-dependent helicase HrpB
VILAVRLQEMFGPHSTPTICNGAVRVILHLLSPANRPIQITSDLVSFWTTTYVEIRKELAGRYPKHYWPDDPIKAEATTLTKKAMDRKQKENANRALTKKR